MAAADPGVGRVVPTTAAQQEVGAEPWHADVVGGRRVGGEPWRGVRISPDPAGQQRLEVPGSPRVVVNRASAARGSVWTAAARRFVWTAACAAASGLAAVLVTPGVGDGWAGRRRSPWRP